MITLTLKPLTDKYKVISTRVTEIEKCITPPIYQSYGDRREEIFKDWHTIWTIVQSYIMNKNTLPMLIHLFWKQLEEYKWIENIDQMTFEENWVDTWIKLSDVECVSVSNKFFLRIEYGEYCIFLSWENDCICYSDDRGYYMSDVKFVGSRWKNLDGKMQCFFYPLMFALTAWISSDVEFEYWCFLKNKKKPVLQRLTTICNIEKFIEELPNYLDEYIRQNDDKFISSDEHWWHSVSEELWHTDNMKYWRIGGWGDNNTVLGEGEEVEQYRSRSA